MKEFEVIREIYNDCAKKYFLDASFDDLVVCDNIEDEMKKWYGGELPKHTVKENPDGSRVYEFETALPERYTITEL